MRRTVLAHRAEGSNPSISASSCGGTENIMPNHIEFVKSQVVFHEIMADKYKATPKRRDKHLETATQLKSLLDYVISLEQEATSGPPRQVKPIQLGLSFEEIEGLPSDLIQELSFSDGDRTDFTIIKVIEAAGGIASLDRILVGYYRETGEIMKRNTLTSRIYRMGQKGLVFQVPGKKGVYSTEEMSEEQAENLFSK